MAKSTDSIFALIAQAPASEAPGYLTTFAALRKTTVEKLAAEFETYKTENAAKVEKARKAAEREALKAALAILATEAEDMDLDSPELGEFVERVRAAGGRVEITPELDLDVVLPEVRKGGTGGGKPASDAPQPFLDMAGDRVLGPLTVWAKANLSEPEQIEAGCFRPNGVFRTGKALSTALVKANILTASPVPAA